MRHLHPRRVARRWIQIEAHRVAGLHVDLDLGEPAETQLGPLEVGQHAQRTFQRHFSPAHGLQVGGMVLVRAVAEVQAKDVDAGLGQGLDHARCPACGAQGRDDAGASSSVHGGLVAGRVSLCDLLPSKGVGQKGGTRPGNRKCLPVTGRSRRARRARSGPGSARRPCPPAAHPSGGPDWERCPRCVSARTAPDPGPPAARR